MTAETGLDTATTTEAEKAIMAAGVGKGTKVAAKVAAAKVRATFRAEEGVVAPPIRPTS